MGMDSVGVGVAWRSNVWSGNLNVTGSLILGAANSVSWSLRGQILSPADGQLRLSNNAGTDFGLLQFGGTTNAFPALRRSGTALLARLADDSGYAGLYANTLLLAANGAIGLMFGGNSSAFPALKNASSSTLAVRLADDSGYTTIASSNHLFGGGSYVGDFSDGVLYIANNAGTDVNRLCWGGNTSAFPALKRVGTTIQLRLADDSAYGIMVGAFVAVNSPANTGASQISIGGTTATTVGAAGGASALPATPLGYININVAGTAAKIPYYNA